MILGVSDWLSTKINVEAKFIRLAFIVSFFFGLGVLLYLVLFVVMTLERQNKL